MAEMLTLPDLIDSDLGRAKVEDPVADLDRDLSGREVNAAKRWIKLFGQLLGKSDGSTPDTIFSREKRVDVLVKTAAYALLTTDPRVIQVNDTAGRVDLTLPDPASLRAFRIDKIAGATNGIRLIRHGMEKIRTVAASYDLPGSTTAFAAAKPQGWDVYSDGVDWWVIAMVTP